MAFGNRFFRKFGFMGLVACLSVSACDPVPNNPVAVAPSGVPASNGVGEIVAATVNGKTLFVSDVVLEAEAQGLISPGQQIETDTPMFTRVLNGLIDDELLAQEAVSEKLDQDPFVEHRINVLKNRLLGNALLNRAVDEQAIQRYYETMINLRELELGDEYRVREIVLPSREAADALMQDLADDTDFAVLASNRSIDERTRLEGGDLGWLNPESIRSEYASAILSTPLGGTSDPFETEMGWHLIKVEDKREEPPPSLEELRGQIRNYLVASELERLLTQLHRNANILRNFEEIEGPDGDPFLSTEESGEIDEPTLEEDVAAQTDRDEDATETP